MPLTKTRRQRDTAATTGEPRWTTDPRVILRVLDGAGIVALKGDDATLFRGEAVKAIVEVMDGRTSDEIATLLGGRMKPAVVYFTIGQLERRGYIVPTAAPAELAERAWWAQVGADLHASELQRNGEPAVVVLGAVDDGVVDAVVAGLADAGHDVTASTDLPELEGDAPALLLVLAGDYTDDRLAEVNRRCLDAGVQWLLVWPDAAKPWIGPLIRPGSTACWECLMNRRRTHRRFHAVLGEPGSSSLRMPSTAAPQPSAVVGRLAALEVIKILGGIPQPTVDDAPAGAAILTELELSDWTTRRHVVVRRPQCVACGDPTPVPPSPIRPQAERPRGDDDGASRTVSAEETYRRLRHHVSPITGAVPLLEEQPMPYPGVYIWFSGTNISLAPEDLLTLDRSLRSMTAGKGTTSAQARAGALAESLERYSVLRHGEEPIVRGSLRDLGETAIHPNDAMLFSETQYADAEQHGSPTSWFSAVPARFDEDAEIDWSPVWSLTHEREVLLPTSYCYYGGTAEQNRGIASDSNGCAAGNTLTEAILQAFFELVERDAVAVWWYNRLRRPAVDLASFEDPWIDDMIAGYRARGRGVWALDLTTDLGIPVFAAVSTRLDDDLEAPLLGFGAHVDPRIAVLRALAEVNQMSFVDDRMHDDGRGADQELMSWLHNATIANQPYLDPDPAAAPWRAEEHPRATGADLAEDVRTCRERVERAGMAMYAIDETRPDIGLPVVRVIVPGLRHFWARFAPGRLYDVPVQLGWTDSPTSESDLNPIPFFL